jgi:hypothetical protein
MFDWRNNTENQHDNTKFKGRPHQFYPWYIVKFIIETKGAIMFKSYVTASICLVILFFNSLAYAANSDDNYIGDRLSFPTRVFATYSGAKKGETVCIPARTALRGLSKVTEKGLTVSVIGPTPVIGKDIKGCEDDSNLESDIDLNISKEEFEKILPNRYGFCYGALVVPYKYHFNGSKEFNGNSTIGPYLGYRLDKASIGVAAEFIGFAGASNVSVTQTTNGQASTQNLAGFSYGVGIIGVVKSDFQLGVVLGFDTVSKSANYVDNNKPWVAISIGYSFAQ